MLYPNGNSIEGVAFIEAKRIYFPEEKFTALKADQLDTLSNNSFSHRTVFYDYEKRTDGTQAPLALGLPTRHLIALDDKTRGIYPYCEQYSYILTNRYLQGYELDYNQESIDGAKGLLNSNGGVDYLIVAQTTSSPEVELDMKNIELNKEIYMPINNEEPDNTPTNNSGGLTM